MSASYPSRFGRLYSLVRAVGPFQAVAIALSTVEDQYFRVFDRRFRVKTSGYIALDQTSIVGTSTKNLHRYRGVNAWAFRKLLEKITPSKELRFCDLGCGLGRACILAAEFGFSEVTGVELVPEFCALAEKNVIQYRNAFHGSFKIQILNMDAVKYTAEAKNDLYFLFRPFSGQVLADVCENIRRTSQNSKKQVLIVYSERMNQTNSNHPVFVNELQMAELWKFQSWGQSFWGFSVE